MVMAFGKVDKVIRAGAVGQVCVAPATRGSLTRKLVPTLHRMTELCKFSVLTMMRRKFPYSAEENVIERCNKL